MGLLIGAFIIILVGVVLIDVIADSVSEFDDTILLANNESITWGGNYTWITLANDDIVSNSETVYNGTDIMTVTTEYEMTSSAIRFMNTSNQTWLTGSLNITYTHEADNYLDDATSRSLIGLVTLFFALTILAVGYLIVKRAYDNLNL